MHYFDGGKEQTPLDESQLVMYPTVLSKFIIRFSVLNKGRIGSSSLFNDQS